MRNSMPVAHLESEEEYFHRLDQELIEELRKRAAAEEEHRLIGEASHIADSRILERLEKLGYTHATVILLELVPLIELAWSDGAVRSIERDRILAMAGARGVQEGTPAYEQLLAWLEQSPSGEFFEETWHAIEREFESLPAGERELRKNGLLKACREFASATCQHFGWATHICAAKRKLLYEIDARLAEGHVEGRL